MAKAWPTSDQLLAWYLHFMLEKSPPVRPDDFLDWFAEFKRLGDRGVHSLLCAQDSGFAANFAHPDDNDDMAAANAGGVGL